MTRSRLPLILGTCFLLAVVGLIVMVWQYLFGANDIESAELVPADTIFFASIPNATPIVLGYRASQLKMLVDDTNAAPIADFISSTLGPKNTELLSTLAPCLSGQSFIAVTKFDPDHPNNIGIIAAMRPKSGTDTFDAFIAKIKATWPDEMKKATTGQGSVAGTSYQWLQPPGAADKICVARVGGWIVTTWGEAPLQDWLERYHKRSTTPTLTTNTAYQASLSGIGLQSLARTYVNTTVVHDITKRFLQHGDPNSPLHAQAEAEKVIGNYVPSGQGSWFQGGEIADRYLYPSSSLPLAGTGLGETICPFETLNFASEDNRFYWGSSVNWPQLIKYLEDTPANASPIQLVSANLLNYGRGLLQKEGVDFDKDVVGLLGNEISLQVEWNPDDSTPEVGLFVKLEKPEAVQPIITKLVNRVRLDYIQSAVLRELTDEDRKYAVLRFIQPSIFAPTITENGPYLGLFSSDHIAVRAFHHDVRHDLFHNDDFKRQIGDKSKTASQLAFMQTPLVLDRVYRLALPYLSLASMFSKEAGDFLKDKKLPEDLVWVAPMGSWSGVVTPTATGQTVDSISGVGNQGSILALALEAGIPTAQSMGYLSKDWTKPPQPSLPPIDTPAPAVAPAPAPTPAPDATTNAAPSAPAPVPEPAKPE